MVNCVEDVMTRVMEMKKMKMITTQVMIMMMTTTMISKMEYESCYESCAATSHARNDDVNAGHEHDKKWQL